MTALTKHQETDLERFVRSVLNGIGLVSGVGEGLASVALAKGRLYELRELPGWGSFTTSLTGLDMVTRQLFREMQEGNLDRYGLGELGEGAIINGLRSAITTPGGLSIELASLLAYEAGAHRTSLRHYVDAGLALEELCVLDPSYTLVKMGVGALSKGIDFSYQQDYGTGIVALLKNTVARTFLPV
jgi:hypothetical protein